MNTKQRILVIYFWAMGLLVSGCGSVQIFAPTPTDIPKILNPENGHWYLVIYTSMSWAGAKDYCRNMKADLVTIASEQENQFVYNLNPNSWIGLSDAEEEGNWKWVTDEPVKYTNWAQTEPNNCTDCTDTYIKEGENSAHFNDNPPDKWNDWPNLESTFICEWETTK